jgi:CelD/BcsL family acetyltransferase involved in cellulose biosynthesis
VLRQITLLVWPDLIRHPAAACFMVEIIEINDVEELSQYRLLWSSLFRATPHATFFLTVDWLETCWRHFGSDHKLRVLMVFAAGEPLGILPLCVRAEKYGLSRVRVLTYPLDNWGTWYGPIGPNPAATMLAAMQHLRRTPRDWDMIELRWVADDATQGGKTARALRAAGLLSEKKKYQATSIVDLPANWDEFVAAKPQTLRRQFRRTLCELAESGRAEYVRHRPAPASEGDGDPRWDLYEMCETVDQEGWHAEVTHGNTPTPDRVRGFFRDAHAAAAHLGMVDMNLLVIEGRPAAFLYGYHYQGHVTALRTGCDASINGDIGSALMLKSIEDSCRRGDRAIDFGPGEREHQQRLRTRLEFTYRLTYTPLDSWRSQAVRWGRWAKARWQRNRTDAQPQPASA